MRRRPMTCASVALLVTALGALGCEPGLIGGEGAPSATSESDGGAGAEPVTEGGSDVGGSSDEATLGDLPVEVLPGDSCTAMPAEPVELYGPDEAPLYADRLVSVGSRRVAASSVEDAFVAFEDDGSFKSKTKSPGLGLHRVAPQGDRLLVASLEDDQTIAVHRYEESMKLVDATEVGAGPAEAMAITTDSQSGLVAWSWAGEVLAVVLDDDAMPLTAEMAVTEEPLLDDVSLAAASAHSTHVLAWAGATARGYIVHLALIHASGQSVVTSEILHSDEPVAVVDLVATADGFVLLVRRGAFESFLVPLDLKGVVRAPAVQLLDVYPAWGLAHHDGTLAVVAPRMDGPPALRMLDGELQAQAPWLCLTATGDLDLPAAVGASDDGFATVFPGSALDDQSPALLFARLQSAASSSETRP